MAYFGGGGVKGNLHPSLRAYIDCFMSSPLPKMYPRGGGPWDQDPILMRDFRIIRAQEVQWKNTEQKLEQAKSDVKGRMQSSEGGGGFGGIENALNEYLEDQGEDGLF